MKGHPNATVGASVGGAATAVVLILGAVGVTVDPALAALLVTAASAVALFIGRRGIRGAIDAVWRGKKATR